MSQIAVAPFVLKDVTLTIDVDSYEKHVSSVQFVPNVSTVTWQGLAPGSSFTDTTAPTWTCVISYAQDWETADSLSRYLMDNAGQTKTAVFSPKGTGTGLPSFTADVIIAPGPIGGDVNTVQTGSVTLGVDGEPTPSTQT